jgi:hypothetical protein
MCGDTGRERQERQEEVAVDDRDRGIKGFAIFDFRFAILR